MRTARNPYGVYFIPEDACHVPVAKRILAGRIHERRTIEAILLNADRGVVVHAGAFFGDFLPAIAGRDRYILAFEPVPENAEAARKTVEANQLHNVTLKCAALGAESGQTQIRTRDGDSHLGGGSHVSDDGNLTVPVTTIDAEVGSQFCTLIHLDVEGSEERALVGAMRTIRRCKPILILETFGDRLRDPVYDDLRGLGYKRVDRVGGNHVFAAGPYRAPRKQRGRR